MVVVEEVTKLSERRDMHGRHRYWISEGDSPSDDGMVEIVDPVENTDFCANCERVCVTHDGKLGGCLNRTNDLRSMGEMSKAEIRATFHETVANRVPYYGEYLVQDDDGEWLLNDDYFEAPAE